MSDRCQCTSPDCVSTNHTELECSAASMRRVRSRDWDEGEYAMCFWCGASAVMSGIFEEATDAVR